MSYKLVVLACLSVMVWFTTLAVTPRREVRRVTVVDTVMVTKSAPLTKIAYDSLARLQHPTVIRLCSVSAIKDIRPLNNNSMFHDVPEMVNEACSALGVKT